MDEEKMRRCCRALQVLQEQEVGFFYWEASHSCLHTSQKLRIVTTSAGTAHTPSVIDSEGFPVTEASASAQYLIRFGRRRRRRLQSHACQGWGGREAHRAGGAGMGYHRECLVHPRDAFRYPRMEKVRRYDARSRSKAVTVNDRLLVVTSDFHLNRTKAIFEWVFALPPAQRFGVLPQTFPLPSPPDLSPLSP